MQSHATDYILSARVTPDAGYNSEYRAVKSRHGLRGLRIGVCVPRVSKRSRRAWLRRCCVEARRAPSSVHLGFGDISRPHDFSEASSWRRKEKRPEMRSARCLPRRMRPFLGYLGGSIMRRAAEAKRPPLSRGAELEACVAENSRQWLSGNMRHGQGMEARGSVARAGRARLQPRASQARRRRRGGVSRTLARGVFGCAISFSKVFGGFGRCAATHGGAAYRFVHGGAAGELQPWQGPRASSVAFAGLQSGRARRHQR
ncbi:hypothetical protein PSPO01_09194 [Paraphaeosphaeria sporulosa]